MKKVVNVLRSFWHALFYIITPKSFHRYAMTCKQTVMELNSKKGNNFRVKLHLSLCQACANYESYSRWLRQSITARSNQVKPENLSQKIFKRLSDHDDVT